MKDIAEMAHTSINTVSKALRNHPQISSEKRDEILSLANEMGYIPNSAARTLRQRKSRLIGIIVGDNANPYFATMIKTAQQMLKKYNYLLITFNNYENVEDEMRFMAEMCGLNVAGVLISPAMGNGKSTDLLRRHNIPFVYMNRTPENTTDSYVVANDEYAAYLATSHLISRKHERVFYINYFKNFVTARYRFNGYKRALLENGMDVNMNCVIDDCTNRTDGYNAMQSLLKKYEPPFSVLCYSDYIATGVLSAIWDAGYRVPEDCAVIGIDDSDNLLNNAYGLSSVRIPVRDIVEKAVMILLNKIQNSDNAVDGRNGVNIPDRLMLEPQLHIRQST